MASSSDPRATALAAARLLVLDVDGTLTDGRIVLTVGNWLGVHESKCFDVRDGIGVRWLVDSGVRVVWISGRGSPVVRRRARELGVLRVLERVGDKQTALATLQSELGIAPAATIAMGDDLPDLGLAACAALFACPADARPEVKERAGFVARADGGRGAVRELAEAILVAQDRWRAIVAAQSR